jgi:hypothetical protein
MTNRHRLQVYVWDLSVVGNYQMSEVLMLVHLQQSLSIASWDFRQASICHSQYTFLKFLLEENDRKDRSILKVENILGLLINILMPIEA